MRYQRVLWVFVLGMGLALALLGVLNARPEAALANTLCVTPGGSGGCYASIQAAVDAADDNDTIRVAAGTYYEAVVLTESVTLEGGWNADFTVRDWELYGTTIDAQRAGPVIWVNAPVTTTIDGFTLTGGDDTADLGWGGRDQDLPVGVISDGGIDHHPPQRDHGQRRLHGFNLPGARRWGFRL